MTNVLNYYAAFFKGWQVKALGEKPSVDMFSTVHALGVRPGSKVALAIAMYLRETGATQGQVITACGGPQLNKMRGFIESGVLKREAMPANDAGHTVYRVTLKAKGAKVVAKATAAEAEADTVPAEKPAVKAKRARRARAAVDTADKAAINNDDATANAPVQG